MLSKSLVAETKEQQSARVSKQADDDLNAYMTAHNLSDLNGVKALIFMTINKGYVGSDIVWGLTVNEDFLTESKIDSIKAFNP